MTRYLTGGFHSHGGYPNSWMVRENDIKMDEDCQGIPWYDPYDSGNRHIGAIVIPFIDGGSHTLCCWNPIWRSDDHTPYTMFRPWCIFGYGVWPPKRTCKKIGLGRRLMGQKVLFKTGLAPPFMGFEPHWNGTLGGVNSQFSEKPKYG